MENNEREKIEREIARIKKANKTDTIIIIIQLILLVVVIALGAYIRFF